MYLKNLSNSNLEENFVSDTTEFRIAEYKEHGEQRQLGMKIRVEIHNKILHWYHTKFKCSIFYLNPF